MSAKQQRANLRIGVDTGGTFTDLVIQGLGNGVQIFKGPTTPDEPIRGLVEVIHAAANDLGMDSRQLLDRVSTIVYGTTRATNAIVQSATARTALITTEGHRDILVIREGGGRPNPLDYTQAYPEPYVPRRLTFEVSERVLGDGGVKLPLDEAGVLAAIEEIQRQSVEAVAVCLLWSIANPAHERRIGELLEAHAPSVSVTLSHRLNPTIREYRRACSAVIDASLKPLMSRHLADLEGVLRSEGFGGRLLLLTASGGVLDAAYVAREPIHSIGSGPAAAPVAGRHFARADADAEQAIVTDAGGTTFDVSLVREGRLPWARDAQVRRGADHYLTGFPAVDVISVGAGGGSIAWVDSGGLLHVGPQSAGADPGPACWCRGGTEPTVTDACVVLGYIAPDYFLGGTIAIDATAAEDAIRRVVADPLAVGTEEAAAGILELACERMAAGIENVTLKQGVDSRSAVMIAGGGGAGLYAVPIARRLGIRTVVIPPVSAALSAAGALLSDLTRSFTVLRPVSTASFDYEAVNAALAQVRAQAESFLADVGANVSESSVEFLVEARYPDQVWEIEVALPVSSFSSSRDVDQLERAFHQAHEMLFAVADRGSSVEVVAWRARAASSLGGSTDVAVEAPPVRDATDSKRAACFPGVGRLDACVTRLASLKAGDLLAGPALVESPVTTIVVPPGAVAQKLASGSLVIEPFASAADGGR